MEIEKRDKMGTAVGEQDALDTSKYYGDDINQGTRQTVSTRSHLEKSFKSRKWDNNESSTSSNGHIGHGHQTVRQDTDADSGVRKRKVENNRQHFIDGKYNQYFTDKKKSQNLTDGNTLSSQNLTDGDILSSPNFAIEGKSVHQFPEGISEKSSHVRGDVSEKEGVCSHGSVRCNCQVNELNESGRADMSCQLGSLPNKTAKEGRLNNRTIRSFICNKITDKPSPNTVNNGGNQGSSRDNYKLKLTIKHGTCSLFEEQLKELERQTVDKCLRLKYSKKKFKKKKHSSVEKIYGTFEKSRNQQKESRKSERYLNDKNKASLRYPNREDKHKQTYIDKLCDSKKNTEVECDKVVLPDPNKLKKYINSKKENEQAGIRENKNELKVPGESNYNPGESHYSPGVPHCKPGESHYSPGESCYNSVTFPSHSYRLQSAQWNSSTKCVLRLLKRKYRSVRFLFAKEPTLSLYKLDLSRQIKMIGDNFEVISMWEAETDTSVCSEETDVEKDHNSEGGTLVDPRVMSLSRALESGHNGKVGAEKTFKNSSSKHSQAKTKVSFKLQAVKNLSLSKNKPLVQKPDWSKLKQKLKEVNDKQILQKKQEGMAMAKESNRIPFTTRNPSMGSRDQRKPSVISNTHTYETETPELQERIIQERKRELDKLCSSSESGKAVTDMKPEREEIPIHDMDGLYEIGGYSVQICADSTDEDQSKEPSVDRDFNSTDCDTDNPDTVLPLGSFISRGTALTVTSGIIPNLYINDEGLPSSLLDDRSMSPPVLERECRSEEGEIVVTDEPISTRISGDNVGCTSDPVIESTVTDADNVKESGSKKGITDSDSTVVSAGLHAQSNISSSSNAQTIHSQCPPVPDCSSSSSSTSSSMEQQQYVKQTDESDTVRVSSEAVLEPINSTLSSLTDAILSDGAETLNYSELTGEESVDSIDKDEPQETLTNRKPCSDVHSEGHGEGQSDSNMNTVRLFRSLSSSSLSSDNDITVEELDKCTLDTQVSYDPDDLDSLTDDHPMVIDESSDKDNSYYGDDNVVSGVASYVAGASETSVGFNPDATVPTTTQILRSESVNDRRRSSDGREKERRAKSHKQKKRRSVEKSYNLENDSDELPKIRPPKRRHRPMPPGGLKPTRDLTQERLLQDLPNHNWLFNKYNVISSGLKAASAKANTSRAGAVNGAAPRTFMETTKVEGVGGSTSEDTRDPSLVPVHTATTALDPAKGSSSDPPAVPASTSSTIPTQNTISCRNTINSTPNTSCAVTDKYYYSTAGNRSFPKSCVPSSQLDYDYDVCGVKEPGIWSGSQALGSPTCDVKEPGSLAGSQALGSPSCDVKEPGSLAGSQALGSPTCDVKEPGSLAGSQALGSPSCDVKEPGSWAGSESLGSPTYLLSEHGDGPINLVKNGKKIDGEKGDGENNSINFNVCSDDSCTPVQLSQQYRAGEDVGSNSGEVVGQEPSGAVCTSSPHAACGSKQGEIAIQNPSGDDVHTSLSHATCDKTKTASVTETVKDISAGKMIHGYGITIVSSGGGNITTGTHGNTSKSDETSIEGKTGNSAGVESDSPSSTLGCAEPYAHADGLSGEKDLSVDEDRMCDTGNPAYSDQEVVSMVTEGGIVLNKMEKSGTGEDALVQSQETESECQTVSKSTAANVRGGEPATSSAPDGKMSPVELYLNKAGPGNPSTSVRPRQQKPNPPVLRVQPHVYKPPGSSKGVSPEPQRATLEHDNISPEMMVSTNPSLTPVHTSSKILTVRQNTSGNDLSQENFAQNNIPHNVIVSSAVVTKRINENSVYSQPSMCESVISKTGVSVPSVLSASPNCRQTNTGMVNPVQPIMQTQSRGGNNPSQLSRSSEVQEMTTDNHVHTSQTVPPTNTETLISSRPVAPVNPAPFLGPTQSNQSYVYHHPQPAIIRVQTPAINQGQVFEINPISQITPLSQTNQVYLLDSGNSMIPISSVSTANAPSSGQHVLATVQSGQEPQHLGQIISSSHIIIAQPVGTRSSEKPTHGVDHVPITSTVKQSTDTSALGVIAGRDGTTGTTNMEDEDRKDDVKDAIKKETSLQIDETIALSDEDEDFKRQMEEIELEIKRKQKEQEEMRQKQLLLLKQRKAAKLGVKVKTEETPNESACENKGEVQTNVNNTNDMVKEEIQQDNCDDITQTVTQRGTNDKDVPDDYQADSVSDKSDLLDLSAKPLSGYKENESETTSGQADSETSNTISDLSNQSVVENSEIGVHNNQSVVDRSETGVCNSSPGIDKADTKNHDSETNVEDVEEEEEEDDEEDEDAFEGALVIDLSATSKEHGTSSNIPSSYSKSVVSNESSSDIQSASSSVNTADITEIQERLKETPEEDTTETMIKPADVRDIAIDYIEDITRINPFTGELDTFDSSDGNNETLDLSNKSKANTDSERKEIDESNSNNTKSTVNDTTDCNVSVFTEKEQIESEVVERNEGELAYCEDEVNTEDRNVHEPGKLDTGEIESLDLSTKPVCVFTFRNENEDSRSIDHTSDKTVDNNDTETLTSIDTSMDLTKPSRKMDNFDTPQHTTTTDGSKNRNDITNTSIITATVASTALSALKKKDDQIGDDDKHVKSGNRNEGSTKLNTAAHQVETTLPVYYNSPEVETEAEPEVLLLNSNTSSRPSNATNNTADVITAAEVISKNVTNYNPVITPKDSTEIIPTAGEKIPFHQTTRRSHRHRQVLCRPPMNEPRPPHHLAYYPAPPLFVPPPGQRMPRPPPVMPPPQLFGPQGPIIMHEQHLPMRPKQLMRHVEMPMRGAVPGHIPLNDPRTHPVMYPLGQKRTRGMYVDIEPAHTKPPPPKKISKGARPLQAHSQTFISMTTVFKKMNKSYCIVPPAILQSGPYFKRKVPVYEPPNDRDVNTLHMVDQLKQAHSQKPFSIAGQLIVSRKAKKRNSLRELITSAPTRNSSVPPETPPIPLEDMPRPSSANPVVPYGPHDGLNEVVLPGQRSNMTEVTSPLRAHSRLDNSLSSNRFSTTQELRPPSENGEVRTRLTPCADIIDLTRLESPKMERLSTVSPGHINSETVIQSELTAAIAKRQRLDAGYRPVSNNKPELNTHGPQDNTISLGPIIQTPPPPPPLHMNYQMRMQPPTSRPTRVTRVRQPDYSRPRQVLAPVPRQIDSIHPDKHSPMYQQGYHGNTVPPQGHVHERDAIPYSQHSSRQPHLQPPPKLHAPGMEQHPREFVPHRQNVNMNTQAMARSSAQDMQVYPDPAYQNSGAMYPQAREGMRRHSMTGQQAMAGGHQPNPDRLHHQQHHHHLQQQQQFVPPLPVQQDGGQGQGHMHYMMQQNSPRGPMMSPTSPMLSLPPSPRDFVTNIDIGNILKDNGVPFPGDMPQNWAQIQQMQQIRANHLRSRQIQQNRQSANREMGTRHGYPNNGAHAGVPENYSQAQTHNQGYPVSPKQQAMATQPYKSGQHIPGMEQGPPPPYPAALARNNPQMSHGAHMAPHGKSSMAPQRHQQQTMTPSTRYYHLGPPEAQFISTQKTHGHSTHVTQQQRITPPAHQGPQQMPQGYNQSFHAHQPTAHSPRNPDPATFHRRDNFIQEKPSYNTIHPPNPASHHPHSIHPQGHGQGQGQMSPRIPQEKPSYNTPHLPNQTSYQPRNIHPQGHGQGQGRSQMSPQIPSQQQGHAQSQGQHQISPQIPSQQQGHAQSQGQHQISPQIPSQQQGHAQSQGQQQMSPQIPSQQQGHAQSQGQQQMSPQIPSQQQGHAQRQGQHQMSPRIPSQQQGQGHPKERPGMMPGKMNQEGEVEGKPHLQQVHGLCVLCGKYSLYLCSSCKKMWYCSPECQLKHWQTHATECKGSVG